jgi:hypothetical protein
MSPTLAGEIDYDRNDIFEERISGWIEDVGANRRHHADKSVLVEAEMTKCADVDAINFIPPQLRRGQFRMRMVLSMPGESRVELAAKRFESDLVIGDQPG